MNKMMFLAGSVLILTIACGGHETKTGDTTTPAAEPSRNLTIKGSDTMVILGQRFAEEYMKKNPGAVIQVNGGGSGVGIAALINGTLDLAEASRPMKPEEIQDVKTKRNADVKETPVALDALSVFVNVKNPVRELSIDQLAGIYTGTTTDWKQVGGKPGKIVLYGRENSSGTYEYFKEHVLNKKDFAARTQTLQGTAAVINAVSKDVNGIGYGGVAYAKDVASLGIKAAGKPAVTPSEETVRNGTYPIARKLYFYSVPSNNPEVEKFTAWAISPEGQAVVKDVGYFPLADMSASMQAATTTTTATPAP